MADENRVFGDESTYGEPGPIETPEPRRVDAGLNLTSPTLGDDLLDELRNEAQTELVETTKLVVPRRPKWALEFNTNVTRAELRNWEMRSSRGKGGKAKTDEVLQSGLMLLEKSTGVFRINDTGGWSQVMDSDGDPLNLRSDEWLDLYPDHGRDTLRCLVAFAGDSGVLAMSSALIDAAGWGEAADAAEDPTERR